MSTQMREEAQPMPASEKVRVVCGILKRFIIMAAMEGVGAKQEQEVTIMSTCRFSSSVSAHPDR